VRQRSATLVEVLTDEGLVGWGEAFAQGLEPPEIAAAAIEHALKPLVLGADPRDTEVLWHRMYHATRDYGRKGSVVSAISAVDIALWDLAGKAQCAGAPAAGRRLPHAGAALCHRLLPHPGPGRGGTAGRRGAAPPRRRLPADEGEAGLRRRRRHRLHAAIGRAIEGRGVTLMVDTNHAYGRAEALRLGRALTEHGLRWYEEPVVPEDLAAMPRCAAS
jgi:D-galactarolactone cycloisomerase